MSGKKKTKASGAKRPNIGPCAMLAWMLNRIASLSSNRADQHLRYEFGDEATDECILWLDRQGIGFHAESKWWAWRKD